MNNGGRRPGVVNYQGSGAAIRIQSDVLASSNKKNEKRGNKNDTL